MEENLAMCAKCLRYQDVVHLRACSNNVEKLNDNGLVIWNDKKYENFELTSERDGIIIVVPGWYILNLKVHLRPQSNWGTVDVRKNNDEIDSSQVPFAADSESVAISKVVVNQKKNQAVSSPSKDPLDTPLLAFEIGGDDLQQHAPPVVFQVGDEIAPHLDGKAKPNKRVVILLLEAANNDVSVHREIHSGLVVHRQEVVVHRCALQEEFLLSISDKRVSQVLLHVHHALRASPILTGKLSEDTRRVPAHNIDNLLCCRSYLVGSPRLVDRILVKVDADSTPSDNEKHQLYRHLMRRAVFVGASQQCSDHTSTALSGELALPQWFKHEKPELLHRPAVWAEHVTFDVATQRGDLETVQWLVTRSPTRRGPWPPLFSDAV
ncbi:hypothetical protein ON010_g12279 [Phytophthora cinnamomi]|nr:hypothetical protein ON010_g12279 [Phytophthora cinnamomi]